MKNSEKGAFAFQGDIFNQIGLSKREYFIGQVMQGLLSNSGWMRKNDGKKYLMESDIVVEISIKMADALLNELDKQE
jgi:hypothetical protein